MKIQATMSLLIVILGWAMTSAFECTAEPEAVTVDTNTILVLKTATPVKMDGVLDEECWKQAVPVKADYIKGEKNKMSEKPRMIARYAWDDQYLYIGYEIFDTNLVAIGNGVIKGPADNRREGCEISEPADVAEFFIGFDNPNMFWEFHHSASNHINDIMGLVDLPAWKKDPPAFTYNGIYWAKNEYIEDDGENRLAGAVTMKPRADGKPSTVNDGTDTDAGYTAELRFPWKGIAAPAAGRGGKGWRKMVGREITILAVTENGDLKGQPYHTSCADLPAADFFHKHFAGWPRYKLAESAPVAE